VATAIASRSDILTGMTTAPTTPPVSIRAAKPDDAGALAALGRRTFTETFAADNTAEDLAAFLDGAYSDALQRAELCDPALSYLVAERDGALVAFSLLRSGTRCEFTADPAPMELQRFYVDTACHASGVAQALMQATIDVACARGARTLFLGVFERNTRAIRFYSRQGFMRVGTQIFTVGNDDQTDAVMARALDG
jgi:diamine N-acetyltransferase